MEQPLRPLPEDFYKPVSDSQPAGPALERFEFAALENECKGKPGSWDPGLGRELDPVPPNHRAARPLAHGLLERTRDFRPLVWLVEIEANINGAEGVHAALHLLSHFVSEGWETTHPDGSPENAAERARAFTPLRNRRKVCDGLEAAQVFKGAGLDGPVSLRQFLLAAGLRQPRADEVVWQASGMEEVVGKANARPMIGDAANSLRAAAGLSEALHGVLADRMERAPNLEPLTKSLSEYADALQPYAGEAQVEAQVESAEAASAGPSDAPTLVAAAPFGALASKAEAAALLDEVVGYFVREERASPVPLILLKIRDMSAASFGDWRSTLAGNGADDAALDIGSVDASRLEAFGGAGALALEDDEAPSSAPSGPNFEPFSRDIAALRAIIDEAKAIEDAEGQQADLVKKASRKLGDVEGALEFLINQQASAAVEEAPADAAAPMVTGTVRNRAEVKQALDRLAAFYERAEPSNPTAVLVKRAKALVEANFLDTIRELAPNGGESASLRLVAEPKTSA